MLLRYNLLTWVSNKKNLLTSAAKKIYVGSIYYLILTTISIIFLLPYHRYDVYIDNRLIFL